MKKIPLIVIAGPTASGKTALSIDIAKKFNGEIVSADSMQIYKCMDVGTAKPTEDEKSGIVHHLMDFADPKKEYSVADYVKDAHECIEKIVKRGKLPIVVGGTGLYINSLVNDVDFEEEISDDSIRKELNEIAENEGVDRLLEILAEFDPESAKKWENKNLRRIVRAIEFYKLNGKTISEHNRETQMKESRYIPLMMAISWEREILYERIDKRVDIMLEDGLLDEVFSFFKKGYTKKMQSMQGIGYKQFLDYFRGLSTFDEAVRIIKRDSRRYAKRQLTWFRRDERIYYLNPTDDVFGQAESLVRTFLAENQQNFIKL